MKNKLLPVLVASIIAISSISGCNKKQEKNKQAVIEEQTTLTETQKIGNQISDKTMLADTIIYSVVIKSALPPEEWESQRLEHFDREKFVDFLFENIYSGKFKVADYITDAPITIDVVKQMEQEDNYKREKIGQLQFKERWFYNPNNQQLEKQILSITIGYEAYTESGELRGYRGGFTILFPNEQILAGL